MLSLPSSAGVVETGTGRSRIDHRLRPSISVTSVFNPPPPFPNTNYQQTTPSVLTPYAYDFLLWGRDSEPLAEVEVVPLHVHSRLASLRQRHRLISHAFIEAPRDAFGQRVFITNPSSAIAAPVSTVPARHTIVFFEAGIRTGQISTYRIALT